MFSFCATARRPCKGVGTAGTTGALAMMKPQGESTFRPRNGRINLSCYLLVDSNFYKSIRSKSLVWIWLYFSTGYIFLNELYAACKCIYIVRLIYYRQHSKTRPTGELTRRTQNAPKLLVAGTSSRTPLGEVTVHAPAPPDSLAGGDGPYRPTLAQLLGLRVSALRASLRPHKVDFRRHCVHGRAKATCTPIVGS